MDLKQFSKNYALLEKKALEIMKIYNIGHHDLQGIEIEDWNDQLMFNIKTEIYYSGCGSEYGTLEFEIEEMNNSLDYFKNKYKIDVEDKINAEKLAKEKEIEDRKAQKEIKDKANYERLKKKYETNVLS